MAAHPTLAPSTALPLDRPWVIGHRGFPSQYAENSLPSFAAALDAGARGIECDVRATRDGHAVVFHDDSTMRLTGVPGRIEDRTSDQVRTLRLRGPGQAAPSADLAIPDLDDVLVLAAERDAIVLVELKGSPLVFSDLTRAVVASVERTRTADRVAFHSFCHTAIADLIDLETGIPCGPVFDRTPALEAVLYTRGQFAVFAASALTERLAEGLKATGVAIAAYGVDDAATDARLDGLRVGFRITDRPDLLAARRQR